MAKVICTLPNASELINGVKFVSHKDGMISEDISKDEADSFLDIPGYQLAAAATAPSKAEKEAAAKAAAAEKAAAEAAEKEAAEQAAAAEKEAADKAAAEAAEKK